MVCAACNGKGYVIEKHCELPCKECQGRGELDLNDRDRNYKPRPASLSSSLMPKQLTLANQFPPCSLLNHIPSLQKIIAALLAMLLQQVKWLPLPVPFIMVLAAGVIGVIRIAV